jgi:hypothetical protein
MYEMGDVRCEHRSWMMKSVLGWNKIIGGWGDIMHHTVGRPQDGNELKSLARVLAVAMVPSEETLSMVAVG